MAKQTFTTGQVLTAAQMTSLQQTAMGGGSATAKTANYVLVAADAGTTVIMNSGSATTITVNTSLFAAGDTVLIVNQGAGICTVTAGTATVSTAGSLALSQYESGILYFLSSSAAIFNDYTQAGGAAATSWTLINAGGTAMSGSATVSVSSITGYNKLWVYVFNASGASAVTTFRCRPNNVSTTTYEYTGILYKPTGAFFRGLNRSGEDYFPISDMDNAANNVSYNAYFEGVAGAGYKTVIAAGNGDNDTTVDYIVQGFWQNTAAITSISISSTAGNFDAGTLYVYGAN